MPDHDDNPVVAKKKAPDVVFNPGWHPPLLFFGSWTTDTNLINGPTFF